MVKQLWLSTALSIMNLGELVHLARGTFFVLEEKSLPELPWRFIEEDNPDLV